MQVHRRVAVRRFQLHHAANWQLVRHLRKGKKPKFIDKEGIG
jgi:hypothetical protein